jgi:hypothetical protein
MKKISQNMLSIVGLLSVPSSIEEFNSFCTGTDSVLTYGIAEAYYRNVAPKVRSKFLAGVAELTGIEPKVTGQKKTTNAKGEEIVTDIFEKDTIYVKRVLASGVTKEQLQPVLQKAFDEVGWDLSSSRVSGPNAKDKATADAIAAKIEAGGTTVEKVKAFFESNNPGFVLELDEDGSIDLDQLADACRVDRIRREDITSAI